MKNSAVFILIFSVILATTATSRARTTVPWDVSDIRTIAPEKPQDKPSPIALPESGTDLGSVGADWARREVHLISGGADERFLADTNERLDRFFSTTDAATVEGPGATSNVRADSGQRSPASADQWLRPRTVHMTHLGEIELGFNNRTKLSCDLSGGNGAEWNLSKPVSNDVDLRLHHETNTNSLQLRLNW